MRIELFLPNPTSNCYVTREYIINQKQKGLLNNQQSFYWSGREDLNLRPLAPHASALAGLRHAPNNVRYYSLEYKKSQY